MGKKWYTPVPNRLIEDCSLHHTTKRVAVALLLENRRRNGKIRISFEDLAKRSGCGLATTQKAVRELIAHGYVTKENNYRYSLTLGRVVLTKNTYRMVRVPGSYTLVPRTALRRRGKKGGAHASFSVLLYLYRCAGRVGRAYPSLRRMADDLNGCGASKASVCRAMMMLKKENMVIRTECKRMRGDFSCNSYFLTDMVIAGKQLENENISKIFQKEEKSELSGGLKFDMLPRINKITKDHILRRRDKGVCQFGRFYKFLGKFRIERKQWDFADVRNSKTPKAGYALLKAFECGDPQEG